MTIKDTYFIRYDNGKKSVWLNSTDTTGFNDITEKTIRTMLVAESGKIIVDEDGNECGECLWLKDISLSSNYSEIEPKTEEDKTKEER